MKRLFYIFIIANVIMMNICAMEDSSSDEKEDSSYFKRGAAQLKYPDEGVTKKSELKDLGTFYSEKRPQPSLNYIDPRTLYQPFILLTEDKSDDDSDTSSIWD